VKQALEHESGRTGVLCDRRGAIVQDWSFHTAAQSWIWDWICSGEVKYSTYGRGWHPQSPMLGDTALAAALAATYVHAVRDWGKSHLNRNFMNGARRGSACVRGRCHAVGHCSTVWLNLASLHQQPLAPAGGLRPACARRVSPVSSLAQITEHSSS
jgi:hypothetical protein